MMSERHERELPRWERFVLEFELMRTLQAEVEAAFGEGFPKRAITEMPTQQFEPFWLDPPDDPDPD